MGLSLFIKFWSNTCKRSKAHKISEPVTNGDESVVQIEQVGESNYFYITFNLWDIKKLYY